MGADPYIGIIQQDALDSALQIQTFETDIAEESLPEGPFELLTGDVSVSVGKKGATIPMDTGVMNIKEKVNGQRTMRIPLVKQYIGAPNEGSLVDPRGTEEQKVTKYFDVYFNEVNHVTADQNYGIDATTRKPYGMDKLNSKREGTWWKQLYGNQYYQQALIEGCSSNLTQQPTNLESTLHPNWYVPNIDDGNQPAYRADYDNFRNHIVAALEEAGNKATGDAAESAVSLQYIQNLEDWAQTTKLIKPFSYGGGVYFLVLPRKQITWLRHPANKRGAAIVWRDVAKFEGLETFKYPYMVGQIGNIIIVDNQVSPTLTVTGSGSTGSNSGSASGTTMTFAYRGMGNADDGTSDTRDFSTSSWQIGFLLGAEFVWRWIARQPHWENDYAMYDKYVGSGIFTEVGFGRPDFDITSKTNDSVQNFSSIICPFSVPPTDGYAD